MYCMLEKARRLRLPIDIQCELFDRLIMPILIYGSEVWGYENINQVEIFHRKFIKMILHVNRCTPDCMVYSETGRYAVLNQVKCRMIGYWNRLRSGKQSKYACNLYKLVKVMHVDPNNEFSSKWIDMRLYSQWSRYG